MAHPPGLSLVIPVKNEEGNLKELHDVLTRVLTPLGRPYEILFIDDGSSDGSLATLEELARIDPNVEVVSFRGNYGKSAALMAGFKRARLDTVITMDADLQDDPTEIPRLLSHLEQGYDLVTGWKRDRQDPFIKVITSRLFNRVTSWFTGIRLNDYNSGFKIYRAAAVKELDIYGELHRFIPALLGLKHFRVGEIPVKHHPRKAGRTKYGPERFINGFLDLLTVLFLTSYLRSPLHLFGRLGIGFFGAGFLVNSFITYLKLTTGTIQSKYPLLFLGILLTIVGVQLICTGLVAEMISKLSSRSMERYQVAQVVRHRPEEAREGEP